MISDAGKIATETCGIVEIAAYLDGELTPERELSLEAHLAVCKTCVAELNEQKKFLCSLMSSLQNEDEIELPADFTKKIVVNAESTVSGLRRPRERYNAIFICAGLFLFVLFAAGSQASELLRSIYGFFEQTAVVGSFFGRVVYSIFLGIAIVLRAIASQVSADAVAAIVVAGVLIGGIAFISRRILRPQRTASESR